MTTEIKEAVDQINTAFEEFKSTHKDVIKGEIKGYIDPLLEQKFDKINEAISKAEEARDAAEQAQALAKRRSEIENEKSSLSEKERELRTAFCEFLRKGPDRFDEKSKQIMLEATKSLSSGSDSAGGYVVIPQFDNDITRIINETSPVRRVATVKQIGTDQYEKLQITDRPNSGWVDRDETPTETTANTFKKLTIKVHKQYAEPRISQDLIDDAFIDVEAEVRNGLVEQFEITENTAFVSGDGVGQPRGFLDYAAGTSWGQIEQVVSGNASALTADGLYTLVYALKDAYLARAVFMMNRSTVAAIRKLKDGNGNYLWLPGFGSEPATILGYPIARASDMPAITSNALAIAFGDFSRAYKVIDRMGSRILVDPYTAKPFVKYYMTKRVGGAVDNFEAIKIQKVST